MGMEHAHPADASGEEGHSKHCRCLDCQDHRRLRPRVGRISPRVRQVLDHGTSFYAVSAHDLLDMDDASRHGRPGMPY